MEYLLISNILDCCSYITHRNFCLGPIYSKDSMQYMFVRKILLTDTNIVEHNKIHLLSIQILPDILCMDIILLNIHYKWFFSICSKLFHKGQFSHIHLRIINSHLIFGSDNYRLCSLHINHWQVCIHQYILCTWHFQLIYMQDLKYSNRFLNNILQGTCYKLRLLITNIQARKSCINCFVRRSF